MENKGLLFIPDISGFTRFVNETDIDHSRLIIQELLEILINSNQVGLEVSEIEGDAILFYKYGASPSMEELYKQVERMFCEFHQHLIAYDIARFCQCKACTSAINLTLKIITHYGEFTGYNVKHFNKLFGKDVIIAHQLLKNDIDKHEYWLVTKSLAPSGPNGFAEWMKWKSSTKQTEAGDIHFHYTQLSDLKNVLPPNAPMDRDIPNKTKMFTLQKTFDTDIITLFHASGDFRFRHRWQVGVKAVEDVSHFLPRVGMKRKSIYNNGAIIYYATNYSFRADRIEFTETEEKKKNAVNFLLEDLGNNQAKLTLNYYLRNDFANRSLFKLFRRKKVEDSFRQSLTNLETFIKEGVPFDYP
jgi:hypothetical protein